jgi:hypothetical protein
MTLAAGSTSPPTASSPTAARSSSADPLGDPRGVSIPALGPEEIATLRRGLVAPIEIRERHEDEAGHDPSGGS